MRGIAAAAGVTTGYITHYFEDKHALITEVIAHTNASAARRVTRAATRAGGGLAGLEAAVDAMLPLDAARLREWRIWISVWGRTSADDEYAAGYRAGWSGVRDIFVALLEQAVRERELRPDIDVAFEAERLVTVLAGTGLLAGVSKPAVVRAQATRMLTEQLEALRVRRRSAAWSHRIPVLPAGGATTATSENRGDDRARRASNISKNEDPRRLRSPR